MKTLKKSFNELVNNKLSIVNDEIENLVNENRKFWNEQGLPSIGIMPNYHQTEIFQQNGNDESGRIAITITSRTIESDFVQILNKVSNKYGMHYFIDLNVDQHFRIVMYPLTNELFKGMES
jgi:hypothetical protein